MDGYGNGIGIGKGILWLGLDDTILFIDLCLALLFEIFPSVCMARGRKGYGRREQNESIR